MSLAADLSGLVAVNDGESALDQHAADLSYHPGARPDAVVYPTSTAEVAAVLEYADREGFLSCRSARARASKGT